MSQITQSNIFLSIQLIGPAWFPRSYVKLTLTASVFFSKRHSVPPLGRCALVLQRRLMIDVCDQRSWYLWYFCCSFAGSRCQIATVGGREEQRVSKLSGWNRSGTFLPESRQNISFPQITVLAGWLAARSVMEKVIPAGQTVVKVSVSPSPSEGRVVFGLCAQSAESTCR